mgnify:FL=1
MVPNKSLTGTGSQNTENLSTAQGDGNFTIALFYVAFCVWTIALPASNGKICYDINLYGINSEYAE